MATTTTTTSTAGRYVSDGDGDGYGPTVEIGLEGSYDPTSTVELSVELSRQAQEEREGSKETATPTPRRVALLEWSPYRFDTTEFPAAGLRTPRTLGASPRRDDSREVENSFSKPVDLPVIDSRASPSWARTPGPGPGPQLVLPAGESVPLKGLTPPSRPGQRRKRTASSDLQSADLRLMQLTVKIRTMAFVPGPIGIEFEGNTITNVYRGGQAFKLGVLVGWRIEELMVGDRRAIQEGFGKGVEPPNDTEVVAKMLEEIQGKGRPYRIRFRGVKYQPGDIVRVHGLEDDGFNGISGVVHKFKRDRQRYVIRTARGLKIGVSPVNLTWGDQTNQLFKRGKIEPLSPATKKTAEALVWGKVELRFLCAGTIGLQYTGKFVKDVEPDSQADKYGVRPGWQIHEIQGLRCPETEEGVARMLERAKNRGQHFFTVTFLDPQLRDVTFKPGEIGLVYEGRKVVEVGQNSQASRKAVRVGWEIWKIAGWPPPDSTEGVHELMEEHRLGKLTYTVQFRIKELHDHAEVQHILFEPIALGITYQGNCVLEVDEPSQASDKGVQVGWEILSISGVAPPDDDAATVYNLIALCRKRGVPFAMEFLTSPMSPVGSPITHPSRLGFFPPKTINLSDDLT